jgi:Tol biopolymer transport system component
MPQKLTYDEVARIPLLGGDPQIDPAGERIAYVVIQPVRENTKLFRQNIWMVNADGSGEHQFTHGPRADYHPRWSPDGTQLAFLSDRLEDGKLQVCCMPRDGGEACVLTELKGALDASVGRSALQWSPDGKHLYFLMFDPESDDQKKRREKKDDAVEHEKVRCYARLWSLEISTRKLTQITRGNVQVWDYQVSPDGHRFALVISDEPSNRSGITAAWLLFLLPAVRQKQSIRRRSARSSIRAGRPISARLLFSRQSGAIVRSITVEFSSSRRRAATHAA